VLFCSVPCVALPVLIACVQVVILPCTLSFCTTCSNYAQCFRRRFIRQWGPRQEGGLSDRLAGHAGSHFVSAGSTVEPASAASPSAPKAARKRGSTAQSTAIASPSAYAPPPLKKTAAASGARLVLELHGIRGAQLIASKLTPAENFWVPCCKAYDALAESSLPPPLSDCARQAHAVALLAIRSDSLGIPDLVLASVRHVIVLFTVFTVFDPLRAARSLV
jgi:hypothetical protein